MRWVSEARERLRGLLFRGREEAETAEELRFHLEMETERLVREEGLERPEARRRAGVAFGGVERYREEVREARGLAWVPGLSLDFRLGLRMLAKHRGLTLIGGFSVAVAVAVGAFAFEVISEVLHPALPFEGGDRVVSLQYATDNPGNPERRIVHDFVEWRDGLRSVERLGAFRTAEHNLIGGEGPPEPVGVAEITASGFELARTPPLLGRYLVPDDERPGAPPVAVIGHEPWRTRFAGDPAVVGRTVRLGADLYRIVGVMPEGFEFPFAHHFWIPLRVDPSRHPRLAGPQLYVFGRLAPGVTMREAQAEAEIVGRRAAAAHPETHERLRLQVLAYTHEHLDLDHPVIRVMLRFVQLLVAGLLVVVAVNLAILLYARTVARLGEIAVRSALGASRRRILAQLFAEALALSALGALAGLALVKAVLGWVRVQFTVVGDVPFWIEFSLSPATVLYALGLAVLAAAIMGVLPGLKATGGRLYASLRQGGGAGAGLGRVWTALVVAQVAIAVAILPVAVFAVWQVVRMESAGPGFPAEEFVVGGAELSEPAAEAGGDAADADAFASRYRARLAELVSRLEAEPGVTTVTTSSGIPGLDGPVRQVAFEEGAGAPESGTPTAGSMRVAPGLFAAYGAEMLAGRPLGAGDLGGPGGPVVVNRTFVEQLLGNRPALGRRFRYSRPGGAEADGPGEWYEIVGVVEDFPASPIALPSLVSGAAHVYHPLVPGEVHPVVLAVRFRGGVPAGAVRRIREIGAEVDPVMQLRVRPLTELYGSLRAGSRFAAWSLAAVTLSVLLLSAAGIYALTSFTVAQRTREIGIRTALGAHPRRVLRGIFGRVTRQLALGLAVGSL
ncbi:MAG TPA: ABC transporter permease, partial [Longimicrobiaceae bacterium]|nr:ABC transporter permease [Longimicrobiaceae bacterium]